MKSRSRLSEIDKMMSEQRLNLRGHLEHLDAQYTKMSDALDRQRADEKLLHDSSMDEMEFQVSTYLWLCTCLRCLMSLLCTFRCLRIDQISPA